MCMDSGNCTRFCCNPNHALTLNVTAKGDKKRNLLVIKRPFKGCCFSVCCCRKEITVEHDGGKFSCELVLYFEKFE
jgi:hypothetical protein